MVDRISLERLIIKVLIVIGLQIENRPAVDPKLEENVTKY